jgi:hypothetical protein
MTEFVLSHDVSEQNFVLRVPCGFSGSDRLNRFSGRVSDTSRAFQSRCNANFFAALHRNMGFAAVSAFMTMTTLQRPEMR